METIQKRPSFPDFDTLARMAREDPLFYESWRQDLIKEFIENAPAHNQRHLRGVQFKIDCSRQSTGSKLGAAVKIYHEMWASFIGMNENLCGLDMPLAKFEHQFAGGDASISSETRNARIYSFNYCRTLSGNRKRAESKA